MSEDNKSINSSKELVDLTGIDGAVRKQVYLYLTLSNETSRDNRTKKSLNENQCTAFWNGQIEHIPMVAAFARIDLKLLAISGTVEHYFSTKDLGVTAKRSSISKIRISQE